MFKNFAIDILLLEVSKDRVLWKDLSDDSEHEISLGSSIPDDEAAISIWKAAIIRQYADKLENMLKLNFKA